MYRLLLCKLNTSSKVIKASTFYRISSYSFFSPHIFLVTVCAILAPALAFYDKGDVVELTPSNFDRLVTDSDEIWIVEFYAPW